jgi:hypothetical protein
MLDGNAVAGLLQEAFGVEMTTAVVMCAGCGASEPFGGTHVFRGAGLVLRCPHCGRALLTIVQSDADMWVGFAGVRALRPAA